MFAIFSSGTGTINCGTVESQDCDICKRKRRFYIILEYKYWSIYWIFNFLTNKQFSMHCTICGRNWELLGDEEPTIKEYPIPMIDRAGCLRGVIIFAIFLVLITIVELFF